MKYSLYFLIQGHYGIDHFKLRQEIAEQFGEYEAVAMQPPSHLTLKYDFSATQQQLEELEKVLIEYCLSIQDPAYLEFDDHFCHFNQETIYIAPHPSPLLKDQLAELHKRLKSLPWMTWKTIGDLEIERKEAEDLVLHATLAYKMKEGSFDKIWKYLETKKLMKERLVFNHVALTTISNGHLKVDRVFYLGSISNSKFRTIENDFAPTSSLRRSLTMSGHLRIPDLRQEDREDRDTIMVKNNAYSDFTYFQFWRSDHVDRVVRIAGSRVIDGLEAFRIRFSDIFNIIIQTGSKVYIYGGYLRDIFGSGQLSDVLFTCTTDLLSKVSDTHSWPNYRKRDEKTGEFRDDFIAIGDKNAKGKFSGHPLGSGCEGEFTMNMMLYDIKENLIIDPTGRSMIDAESMILAIPCDESDWMKWVEGDRLLGMKFFRYFNFKSRGYEPESEEMRAFIVSKTREYFTSEERKEEIIATLRVFFARKILSVDPDERARKEAKFKHYFIREFDHVYAGEGASFYDTFIAPHFV